MGCYYPLSQKKEPMNRIYSQSLIRKNSKNGAVYNNCETIQLPFPLTNEIEHLTKLFKELDLLTPKIPDDSVKRILEKLNY